MSHEAIGARSTSKRDGSSRRSLSAETETLLTARFRRWSVDKRSSSPNR